jgi:predicted lipid-binding transport protein (Tim44 family)
MGDSLDIYTILFLVLAVFILLRLRSVLGTRTGNERPPYDPFSREAKPAPQPKSGRRSWSLTSTGGPT